MNMDSPAPTLPCLFFIVCLTLSLVSDKDRQFNSVKSEVLRTGGLMVYKVSVWISEFKNQECWYLRMRGVCLSSCRSMRQVLLTGCSAATPLSLWDSSSSIPLSQDRCPLSSLRPPHPDPQCPEASCDLCLPSGILGFQAAIYGYSWRGPALEGTKFPSLFLILRLQESLILPSLQCWSSLAMGMSSQFRVRVYLWYNPEQSSWPWLRTVESFHLQTGL